ncbi:uncharacterized protein LOC120182503 [Hibiscus syriacus]|uniref:uncharacterized protein LOC120182503 n=1 Tax=Hibiscus syriacus TaxID=106335 RepID=UPI0019228C63|nr:uncharacterized protein LOC120182503 [Hibiscus syriacus]
MNVLSPLLDVASKNGIFKYHPKCKRISLTHLCFADDLLDFFHGSLDDVVGVLSTLEVFYELSGLRLNDMKTELYACGVSDLVLEHIHSGTGFKVGKLPVRYLGVPLVTRKLTGNDCSALVIKIKEKLSKWSSHIPKFSLISWMEILDRLPTKDRLARSGLAADTSCGMSPYAGVITFNGCYKISKLGVDVIA